MNKLKAMLTRLMYGRYGMDQLYYGLFIAYLAFFVLGLVSGWGIFSTLGWIAFFLMLFRSFSRSIAKRRAENDKYLKFRKVTVQTGLRAFNRIKDIRTRRYRRCAHCKAVIRLPRVTGKHTVTCPACHKDFDINIRL